MQRQSLGPSASKLHSHGDHKEDNLKVQNLKLKVQVSSALNADHEEDESKSQKLRNSPWRPDRFIHFIPILTLLCFLILYISSHNPSQKDLAQFSGFKLSTKSIDSAASDDDFLEIEKGNVVAIGNLRNLRQSNTNGARIRPHRKIRDF